MTSFFGMNNIEFGSDNTAWTMGSQTKLISKPRVPLLKYMPHSLKLLLFEPRLTTTPHMKSPRIIRHRPHLSHPSLQQPPPGSHLVGVEDHQHLHHRHAAHIQNLALDVIHSKEAGHEG